jgi:hypothetical protein
MPFSLMNGLSAMGASIASFAGTAGLEQQKATLANQQAILADQLATTRESAGRVQAGQIADVAATKAQVAQAGNIAIEQAGANTRNAATIEGTAADTKLRESGANTRSAAEIASADKRAQLTADTSLTTASMQAASETYRVNAQTNDVYAQIAAAEPAHQAQLLEAQQKVAFEAVQTENAKALQTAHTALQTEVGKTDADPAKVANLKSQVTSLETSATTEAATTTAAAVMYRTDMDNVTHLNTQITAATAALNAPEMSDTDRTAQKGLIANLKTQLTGAQRALEYSSSMVHGRVGAETGNTPPGGGGNRPPLASFGTPAVPFSTQAGPRPVAPLGFLNNGVVSP